MVRDHGVELAKRLESFDVDVTLVTQEAGWHCAFWGSALVPEAKAAHDAASKWLSEKLVNKRTKDYGETEHKQSN